MIVIAATVTVTASQAPVGASPTRVETPSAPLDTATTVMYLVDVLVPRTVTVGARAVVAPAPSPTTATVVAPPASPPAAPVGDASMDIVCRD